MSPTELADALERQIMPHDSVDPCEDCDTLRSASNALRRLGRVEAAMVGFVDCACDVCLEHSAIVECPHVVKMHDLRAALRAE